jgi:peptidoglycan/xylan/chitin deacetylase (PgdA/CDA1 family)
MPSREERRVAAAARRRQIRRQKAGLAAGAGLLLVAVLVLLALGGGDTGQAPRSVSAAKLSPSERESAAVDGVLSYTAYLEHGSPRRREVALTFDDGPGPYTRQVVKVLKRLHAPATFFPVGRAIIGNPQALRFLQRQGFPVGDHTMNHPLMGHLPRAQQAQEIDGQARLVRRAGLPYPRLFRPPDGSLDGDTVKLMRRRNMLMVLWSVNPEDYLKPGARAIVSRVMAGARPGSIILLHDGGGNRSEKVAALPFIIKRLRKRHLHLVDVPQMLRDAPPSRHQGPPPNLAGV